MGKGVRKMTEKRFRAVVCVTDWYIEDKEISPFAILTPHQSSDLLNELHKENEQLRTALKELKEIGDYQADRIQELSDENRQLEQQMQTILKLIIIYFNGELR